MNKRFDKMTPREKFVRLMIRGWKEHKKNWSNKHGYNDNGMTQFCAFGVVGAELGLPSLQITAYGIRKELGATQADLPFHAITQASDNATSKTDAIRRVRRALGL